MNPTRTFENSYYYRQLATAYKDYLPKGTTETGIENTLSAFSLGTGLGFGFGFVSLFFNKNIKTSTLSFLGHKFSFTRKVPQLLLKGGLSFIAAYTVKNKIDDLLQHESIQRKIRSANGDQERDFWRTYKFPSGEPIEIGIKNYKMYEDRNLNSIMFSSRSFDQTTTDLLYLQKKEKMLDRIKQTCKSGVLKEINKDTQPSKGLCLGFAMNWMQYLFQNGLESILNRDLDDFENQSTQINTILLHKINEIACSSMKPSLISQSLSSLLDIPQERIHYIPLNSSLIKSNKITEATLYFLLKENEGKIVCLTATRKSGGHAVCVGTLPEKELYFMTSNSHVLFFSSLESLCRGVIGIQKDLCANNQLDYLVVVDPSTK